MRILSGPISTNRTIPCFVSQIILLRLVTSQGLIADLVQTKVRSRLREKIEALAEILALLSFYPPASPSLDWPEVFPTTLVVDSIYPFLARKLQPPTLSSYYLPPPIFALYIWIYPSMLEKELEVSPLSSDA